MTRNECFEGFKAIQDQCFGTWYPVAVVRGGRVLTVKPVSNNAIPTIGEYWLEIDVREYVGQLTWD